MFFLEKSDENSKKTVLNKVFIQNCGFTAIKSVELVGNKIFAVEEGQRINIWGIMEYKESMVLKFLRCIVLDVCSINEIKTVCLEETVDVVVCGKGVEIISCANKFL